MKRTVRLGLSAVMGLSAALLAWSAVAGAHAEAEQASRRALERYGGDVTRVCVALREIEPGDEISEGNVKVVEWVSSLMPEDALTLFLADPSRGDLTEEQKSLARSSYEAVLRCYRRAAWDLLLYNQMLREGVVHDLREFRSLQRRRYAPGDSGRETRCEALCAPDLASPIPAPETGHEGV